MKKLNRVFSLIFCVVSLMGLHAAQAENGFEVKTAELPTGVTLEYVEAGDKAAPAVVLVHGYPDSWRSYETVLQEWPADLHAVALSLRGFGGSSKPEGGYTLEGQAADVHALMDQLGIERAVIVGHSMGSLIASVFSSAYPERTSGVVMIGTFASFEGKPELQSFWTDVISLLEDPLDPAFVREFQVSTVARPVPPAVMDTIIEESLKAPARVWRDMFGSFIHRNFEAAVAATKAPILFVWGSEDWMSSPEERISLDAIAPQSEMLTIAGAGHSPQWEDPSFMAGLIVDFAKAAQK